MQREFPHLIKYLPQQAPNEDIIEREQKKSLITIYQLDYSPQWGRTIPHRHCRQ